MADGENVASHTLGDTLSLKENAVRLIFRLARVEEDVDFVGECLNDNPERTALLVSR